MSTLLAEDLITMIYHASPLGESSFTQGCAVLNAVELFDKGAGSNKLGTWQKYNTSLLFVPVPGTEHGQSAHPDNYFKLAEAVFAWQTAQALNSTVPPIHVSYAAWIVIDRATRVTWVECGPIRGLCPVHPRAADGAGEFPSSSRGTVTWTEFLGLADPWPEVRDRMHEAYHVARHSLDRED